jgi:bifunctional non-homologous end joining protein LigD
MPPGAPYGGPCASYRVDAWLHEIKHDGFRLMAFRAGDRAALYTRNGHDWAGRYPLVAAALKALRVHSCLIDGEIVVTRPDGVACFDALRNRQHDAMAFVYAFDLLELDGSDLRREPLLVRKATLASVLAKAGAGLRLNEHIEHDGALVFAHACKLGLEGIVSKRKASHYRSGTSRDWLKSKNPASEAVHREAFEHWRR